MQTTKLRPLLEHLQFDASIERYRGVEDYLDWREGLFSWMKERNAHVRDVDLQHAGSSHGLVSVKSSSFGG